MPCMNEEEVLRQTHQHLVVVLQKSAMNFEIVYVDDGSRLHALRRAVTLYMELDTKIRVIQLSRNFGHHVWITAGLEHASGRTRS